MIPPEHEQERFRPLSATDDPSNLWLPDSPTLAIWDRLRPATSVTIVKRAADGTEAARYPGVVSREENPGSWRTLIATWTMREVTEGGLTFATGDTLHERFSPEHPFNAFGVEDREGRFKGWYANVTWPSTLEDSPAGLVLTWQDLILDIVALADGTVCRLDDHELDGSSDIRSSAFAAAIRATRDQLVARFRSASPPFHPLQPASLQACTE